MSSKKYHAAQLSIYCDKKNVETNFLLENQSETILIAHIIHASRVDAISIVQKPRITY